MEIEGIVLHQTQFQDNDMMVTLLSKERKYSFLARGVLKLDSKNSSSIVPFTYGKYNLMSGKKGKTLKNALVINTFPNIRKDLTYLAALDFIAELTMKQMPDDKVSEVYPYLLRTLELLNSGFDSLTLLLIYFAAILRISGYGLDVDECVICGKKTEITAISYEDGGFICLDCFNPLKHTKCTVRKLKIIRYIFKVDPARMDKIAFERAEVLEVLNELISFASINCDLYLKSVSLLKSI